ncbi:MAG TPA: hypothetical protein VFB54_16970 [Burkholderiales bacterium]|nr:hypothetical protein [Burkholderiales bacterium]
MKSTLRTLSLAATLVTALAGAGSAFAEGRDSVYAFGKSASPAPSNADLTQYSGRDSFYASRLMQLSPPDKGAQYAGNGRSSVFARS